jgi:hypothetical protein
MPSSDASSEESSSESESLVVPDSASDSDDASGGEGLESKSVLFGVILVEGNVDLEMAALAGVPVEDGTFAVAGLIEAGFFSWSEI